MTALLPSDDLWVVIPALNEGAALRAVVAGSLLQCRNVIVVNDGSTDDSMRLLADMPITILHNPTRQGKAHSLWRGFQHALRNGANAIVTLDADGQHLPDDIARFRSRQTAGADALIVGMRPRVRGFRQPLRYMANRLADWSLSLAATKRFLDTQSGYRLYPARLLRRLSYNADLTTLDLAASFVFESEVLLDAARVGYRIEWVALTQTPANGHRQSHFRPVADSFFIAKRIFQKLTATDRADNFANE